MATVGLSSQAAWWAPPRWEQFGPWDAAALREAGLGQVRIDEAQEVLPLLESPGETANERRRGVGLVYPAMADYYLLFREQPDDRPYPEHLFAEPDPLSQDEAQRRAVVDGALAGTRARSGGDVERFRRMVCSWEPGPEHAAAVADARRGAGVRCDL